MSKAPRTVTEPGMGTLEVFALDTSEAALVALLTDIFENHWRTICLWLPVTENISKKFKACGNNTRVISKVRQLRQGNGNSEECDRQIFLTGE